MVRVSSYKKDILVGLISVGFVCLYVFLLGEEPMPVIIVVSFVCLLYVFLPSREFIADNEQLTVSGPIYLFKKRPSFSYTNIAEVRFHFTDMRGSVSSVTITNCNGMQKSIIHNIKRKAFTPILKILSEHSVPIIIHDPSNADLFE